jgi:hypothetical protein
MVDKLLTAAELHRVHRDFVALRPGHGLEITVRFERNKQENAPLWAGCSPEALGYTPVKHIVVDDTGRKSTGFCLIDLGRVLSSSIDTGGPQDKERRPRPRYFRGKLVTTVVHEAFHVLQGWRLGKLELMATAQKEKEALARNPGELGKLEREAREFASEWFSESSDAIHKGEYDFLVPMDLVRTLFPKDPGAFDPAPKAR